MMPVRLGISALGWSNDDLPELGGDTPLETCLAEAQLAGFEGIELGSKFPPRSGGAEAGPGTVRAVPGRGLVQRPPAGSIGDRGIGGDRGASHAACRDRMRRTGLCGDERK